LTAIQHRGVTITGV